MKVVQSDFIVKGHKNGNCHYITKNKDGSFNVYQLFCDMNKHFGVNDLKKILPAFENLPDDEIIVLIPNEEYHAFLLLYHVDIKEMNIFRIMLDDEKIISM